MHRIKYVRKGLNSFQQAPLWDTGSCNALVLHWFFGQLSLQCHAISKIGHADNHYFLIYKIVFNFIYF